VTAERWLAPVAAALDDAREPVDVFFRDDDAGWGDDRLFALLDLMGRLGLPLDVAAIPGALEADAAAELRRRAAAAPDLVGLHQHGYTHANHEPEGRKQEFGPARSREQQQSDIAAGRERLRELLGDALDSAVFTPPWNRCTADTAAAVHALGFEVLSREARAPRFALEGLRELPVSIDWFAKRKDGRLTLQELGELAADRVRSGEPVGVMLHHAVMDEGEMSSVEPLLGLLAAHAKVRRWRLGALALVRG
jgi:Polysaccharide deacetylase